MKAIFEFIAAIISWYYGQWYATDELRPELKGLSIGIWIIIVIDLLVKVIENHKFILLYFDCIKPFVRKEIRLSMAYLFNIELNGKYLLIRSHRIPSLFQPIGGVYKYLPEALAVLTKMGILPDDRVAIDSDSKFDLRVRLVNRLRLPHFLKWFFLGENRETSPWREFYEELVEENILSKENFSYIHYELIGQHFTRIQYSEHFKMDEFLYADIYKPVFLLDKQKKGIEDLFFSNHPDILWASFEEISIGRTIDGKIIAPHTPKIFKTTKI